MSCAREALDLPERPRHRCPAFALPKGRMTHGSSAGVKASFISAKGMEPRAGLSAGLAEL